MTHNSGTSLEYNTQHDNDSNNSGQTASSPGNEPDDELNESTLNSEDDEELNENDGNTTPEAGEAASNSTSAKLGADRRDVSKASSRANEATDPNDTGSGGISAGGVKSGSSLQ